MNSIKLTDFIHSQLWTLDKETIRFQVGSNTLNVVTEGDRIQVEIPDTTRLTLHLPTHSGIYIDYSFNKSWFPIEGQFSCSMGVLESEGTYYSLFDVNGESSMAVTAGEQGWLWSWKRIGDTSIALHISQSASLEEAVAEYRKLRPLPNRDTSMTEPVKRMITLDMMLSNGDIVHHFDDAVSLIDDLAQKGLAEGTLLYLPGWCGRYDANYPLYNPDERLGGELAFKRLVDHAADNNVLLMPHLNFWGYDPALQWFTEEQLQEIQLQNEDGSPAGWSGATSSFAYMRPDHPVWQERYLANVLPFLEKYDIKAVMLDQIGLFLNDKRCDFARGTLEIINRIKEKHPDILLSGEILNEHIVGDVTFIQLWGMPWCGVDIDLLDWVSPISKLLFPDVTFYGHLGLPSSLPGKYTWTNHKYISEKGIEEAFLAAQNHLSFMGGVPHVRLHYNPNGLDALSLQYLA